LVIAQSTCVRAVGGTHEQTLENLDVAQAVVTLIGHPMTLPTVAD
jgi:hypothetical protein